MDTASALLGLTIAVVFAVSGASKLRSLPHSVNTLSALRLPRIAPRVLVGGLAIVEVILAIGALWAPPIVGIAAVGVALLALAFLVVVIRAHRLGSTDDCGCFGDAAHSPIGPRLIARNGVLLATSLGFLALVTIGSGGGVPTVFSALAAGNAGPLVTVLAAGAITALAVLTLAPRPIEAPVATPMPEAAPAVARIAVLDRAGQVRDLNLHARAKAQLAVFIKPGCQACTAVIEHLETYGDDVATVATVTVVADAPAAASVSDLSETAPYADAIDVGGIVGEGLVGHRRRPIAALIATDGSVVEPVAEGRDQIIELIDVVRAAGAGQ